MKQRFVTGVTIAAMLGMQGCATPVPSPGAKAVTDRLVPVGPSPWRLDFGDLALRDLLRQIDLGSLDIKIAMARLDRADAEVAAARALSRPQVEIGVNGAVGGHSLSEQAAAGSPSLTATYELDIWGRVARARDALEHERRAVDSEVVVARRLVGAEAAQAYFTLRAAQSLTDILDSRRRDAQRLVDLTRARYAAGRASRDEVSSRTQAVADLEAELTAARLEARIETLRLGALLGKTTNPIIPRASSSPWAFPSNAPFSSETVTARPDVAAAYARLKAADSRRAEAVAASRPRFVLSASLGAADPSVINLLDAKSLVWAVAAEVSQSIADGGARKARIGSASAEVDLADLAYRKAVVQAWADARRALAQVTAADADLARADARRLAANEQVAIVRRRHEAGAADALDILGAQDGIATAEIRVNAARLRATSARIGLALAAPGA